MLSKKNKLKVKYDDIVTLSKIYPLSYEFDRNYFLMGDEYVTCLTALNYPSEIAELTLARLMNLSDVKVSVDIAPIDKGKVLKSLSFSIEEYNSRTFQKGIKIAQKDDAATEEYKLRQLSSLLSQGAEEVLAVTVKFWLSGRSEEELYSKVEYFKRKLKTDFGINSFVPANEMDMQFSSLLVPDNSATVPMPMYDTLCKQFPFHGSSMVDKYGWYFGNTHTGDKVILDPFTVTNHRTSFNMLLIGKMGAGKSTTIKSLIQDAIAYGHTVLSLDIEGEQKRMAYELGGTVLTFGQGVTINPLEMRNTSLNEGEVNNDDSEYKPSNKADFTQQLSRVLNFFIQYFGKKEINANNRAILSSGLKAIYSERGINERSNLDEIPTADFPLIEDLINYFESKAYVIDEKTKNRKLAETADEYEPAAYRDIANILKPLVDNYGSIFNQYTSFNLRENNYAVFDISQIQDLERNVSNALMFNILSLMWQEVFRNREYNKDYINDPLHRKYVICVLDEAHRFFSKEQEETINFINKMVRQARKNSAALWFASQSVNDFYPEGNSELGGILKAMFELVPYKILLQMDASAKDKLVQLFPEFHEEEISQTFSFGKGQMMIHIAGEGKFIVNRYVPDEHLEYFAGGR